LKAACAPIASDTMPTRAVATAIERRDTLNCVTFISVRFLLIAVGAQISRALSRLGFGDARTVCRPIVINLRHRSKESLNLLG
jgi:hypothetical protein